MALLDGFGVAKQPNLFGKMLKRSPFMFYINPPKIGDEDLSHIVKSDVSTTASGFVAYGALKVLQLLKAQNFPDLDKIVRTQPTILLVDTTEVKARANFLANLFLENMPSLIDTAAKNNMDLSVSNEVLDIVYNTPVGSPAVTSDNGGKVNSPKFVKNKSTNGIVTSQIVYATQPNQVLNSLSVGTPRFCDTKNNNDQLAGYYIDDSVVSSMTKNQHAAHDMLGALLLTYPAVLSINHQ